MRHFPILLLALAAAGAAMGQGTPAVPRPPNIVVILSDDMGFSDIGCYGGEIRTPNLDRLAAGGLRFTDFYNTARCCPTRASLLTGLYPHQAGVGHMMADRGRDGYRGDLHLRCATIPEMLRPAGYRSYALGKWHVTRFAAPTGEGVRKHNWPIQRGFDRYYGTIHGAGSYWDPTTLCRDNRPVTAPADPLYRPRGRYYYTDALSDNAVTFLRDHRRDHRERPFFLYLAYTAAHWPLHAPEEAVARCRGRYDAGYQPVRAERLRRAAALGVIDAGTPLSPPAGDWDRVRDRRWEARGMEVYAAMVERMDAGIGKLTDELERQGELENTLILYLQDNGGCAETVGRQSNEAAVAGRRFAPMAPDALFPPTSRPEQTRDGRPVRSGPEVLPGPDDTFVAYGRGWANVSNTPFREYKHWVHEGGIATPLVAHWPRGIPAARRGGLVRDPAHVVDLAATCLELAGARVPASGPHGVQPPLEGVSLLPALRGQGLERKAPLFWEHEGNRAVRRGPWKLVAKGPGGPWELYNLAVDRTETRNQIRERPAIARALAREWEQWARRAEVLPWIWEPPYRSTGLP